MSDATIKTSESLALQSLCVGLGTNGILFIKDIRTEDESSSFEVTPESTGVSFRVVLKDVTVPADTAVLYFDGSIVKLLTVEEYEDVLSMWEKSKGVASVATPLEYIECV